MITICAIPGMERDEERRGRAQQPEKILIERSEEFVFQLPEEIITSFTASTIQQCRRQSVYKCTTNQLKSTVIKPSKNETWWTGLMQAISSKAKSEPCNQPFCKWLRINIPHLTACNTHYTEEKTQWKAAWDTNKAVAEKEEYSRNFVGMVACKYLQ